MNTLRTRIARLTAASALVVGLGALGAGPALAAEGEPVAYSVTLAADDDASTDGFGRPGGVSSVEDGAGADSDQSTNAQIQAI